MAEITEQYMTMKEFAKHYPSFSLPAIRNMWHLSRNRVTRNGMKLEGNGFESAFLRLGSRVFIDVRRFFEIFEQKNGKQPNQYDRQKNAATEDQVSAS